MYKKFVEYRYEVTIDSDYRVYFGNEEINYVKFTPKSFKIRFIVTNPDQHA